MNAIIKIQRTAQNSCPDESYKTPPSLSYNASVTGKGKGKEDKGKKVRCTVHIIDF
jgi:hypothetical protein